jgi:hypothetical protein
MIVEYIIRPRKIHENVNRCFFSMTTTTAPNRDDVCRAQEEAGFHPRAYGLPSQVNTKKEGSEQFYTFWSCSSYSD